MNKIFRVIWNHSTQTWMAVSELAKGKVKSSSVGNTDKLSISFKISSLSIAITVGLGVFTSNAFAAIAEGTINGKATDTASLGKYGTPNNLQGSNGDTDNYSKGLGGIAIGQNSVSTYQGGVAVGERSTATNVAVALGSAATANGSSAIALGTATLASGANSLAIMRQAGATGNYSMAIGTAASVSSEAGIGIGKSVLTTGTRAIAIGSATDSSSNSYNAATNTQATGTDSIAFGTKARATNTTATAIGSNTTASGVSSNSIGVNSTASAVNATAIGVDSVAKGANSTAIGTIANASAANTVAIGTNTIAFGTSAVAVGENATAQGNYGIATGANATASAAHSIATGFNATASGVNTFAVGENSTASGPNTVAIGKLSVANATNATAIGLQTNATGESAIAIGKAVNATALNTIAMGNDTDALAENAMAFGAYANASVVNSIAIGRTAVATAANATAIGRQSTAALEGSLALGNGSTTGTSVPATTLNYNFTNASGGTVAATATCSTASSVVSVGTSSYARKITNVAAGTINAASTEAVNGSQLYNVVTNLGFNVQENGSAKSRVNNNNIVNFANGTYTTANVTGTSNTTVKFNVVNQAITSANGVAAVSGTTAGLATAKDVVNAVNNTGFNLQANGASNSFVKSGDTVNFKQGDNILVTKSGNNITVATSMTPTFTMLTTTGDATIGGNLDMTNGKITNLADGTNSNDAVNLSQLKANTTKVVAGKNTTVTNTTGADGTTYTINADDTSASVSTDSSLLTVTPNGSTAAGNATVTDYKVSLTQGTLATNDGVVSTATNGVATTQDVADAIGKGYWKVGNNAGTETAQIKFGDQVNFVNGKGTVSNVSNVKGANVSFDVNVDGKTINVDSDGKLTVNTSALPKGVSVEAGKNTTVTSKPGTNGETIYTVDAEKTTASAGSNAVTVTAGKKDASGVTNYTVDLSDTTKEQLAKADTAIQSFTTSVNGKEVESIDKDNNDVNFVNGTGTTARRDANKHITFDINKATLSKGTDGTITASAQGDNFATAQNVAEMINNASKSAKTEVKEGDNIVVTSEKGTDGQTIYKVATSKDLVVDSVKAGDTMLNKDGLTITGGPNITKSGIDAADNKITNVKDGAIDATSKDAVNGSQLHDVITKGFKINADKGTEDTVALGESVKFTDTSGNIITTVTDNMIAFALANSITVGAAHPITINGTAGTITGLTNKTFDPNNIVTGQAATEDQLKTVADTANSALQEFTTSVNGKVVETISKNNKDVNFVNGTGTTARGDANKHITFDVNKATLSKGTDGTVTASAQGDNFATAQNVAEMINNTSSELKNKGFSLTAEDNQSVKKALGESIAVVGDENINTTVNTGKLEVQLSKNLNVTSVNATTVNATTVKTGDTTMTDNGLTITGGPSITKSGIDAANKKITNVANGTVGADSKDAINGGQLHDVISKGFKINADKGTEDTVALGESVKFTDTSGNIITTVTDNMIAFALANSITVGAAHPITINGTAGTITGLTNKTFDPNNIVTGQAATEDQLKTVADTANSALQEFTTSVNGKVVETISKNNKDVNFVNGTGTTARGDANKHITFDVNKATLSKGTDGTVTASAQGDNFATAENVADVINQTANNLINKGFGLKAEDSKTVTQPLGNTIEVVGDENINTEVKDGKVEVQLSKDLNVNSVNATTVKTGDTTMTDNGITIANGTKGSPVSLTKDGLDNGGNKITNVAAGTIDATSTDAVNGSQLYQVQEAAKAAKTEVVAGKNTTVTSETGANGQSIYTVNADKSVVEAKADSGLTVTATTDAGNYTTTYMLDLDADTKKQLAKEETVKAGSSNIVVSESTNSTGGKEFTVDLAKDIAVDTLKVGDTVNIDANGINAGNTKIISVATGTDDTDAVNVKQLTDTIAASKTTVSSTDSSIVVVSSGNNYDISVKTDSTTIRSGSNGLEVVTGDISTNSDGKAEVATGDESKVATAGDVAKAVNNAAWTVKADKVTGTNGDATGYTGGDKVKAGDTVSINAGNNIVISGSGKNINIATSDTPKFSSVTTKSVSADEVNITNGPSINSNGIDMNNKRITNVAPGRVGTNDAVNMNQLGDAIGKVNNRIHSVDKKLRSGIAGAVAIGSLVQAYNPSDTLLAVGGGTYRGSSALALGYSKVSDNGKIIIKATGSVNNAGHYMGGCKCRLPLLTTNYPINQKN